MTDRAPTTGEPATVSAVILDYKKADRVVENVHGLLRQELDGGLEIIVADNSCDRGNAETLAPLGEIPNVRLIINSDNLGYVRGCNRAAGHATGAYILIVNPDIHWPERDTVQKLVDYLDRNPQVGIVGPKQIDDSTGRVASTARAFPKLLVQMLKRSPLRGAPLLRGIVDRDEMLDLDTNRTQAVDWLQSSCFLLRRGLWERLGGFDERYVMFLADPEICWQAWASGLSVVYYSGTTVRADGRRCSSGGFRDFFKSWVLRQHLKDSIKYRWRHAWRRNPRLAAELSRIPEMVRE